MPNTQTQTRFVMFLIKTAPSHFLLMKCSNVKEVPFISLAGCMFFPCTSALSTPFPFQRPLCSPLAININRRVTIEIANGDCRSRALISTTLLFLQLRSFSFSPSFIADERRHEVGAASIWLQLKIISLPFILIITKCLTRPAKKIFFTYQHTPFLLLLRNIFQNKFT